MLEYVKMILLKVSFDKMIFEKELRKGMKILQAEERMKLKQWCYENFLDKHLMILERLFSRNPGLSF
ncbi:hypothetical protein GZH53_01670 [Flavihumibacter sp. R14]|nr:hypothetical protein [Flavihumibacter soli]